MPANHTLSWQGFSLNLPEDWNLAGFSGDRRAGAATIATLHGPALVVRWKSHRHPDRAMARLAGAFKKRGGKITQDAEGSPARCDIQLDSFDGALLAGLQRLYELQFPTHSINGARLHMKDISFADYSSLPQWPWSVYGIQGDIPRNTPLVKADLHPGHPQLTFRRFGATIRLGAWPLADQLLAGRSLVDWARASIVLLQRTTATLLEANSTHAQFLIDRPWRQSQEFTLTHHPDTNVIRWCQQPKP